MNDEEIKNLEELHNYSTELKNVLNQLATDLEQGAISWKDLKFNENEEFAQAVSSNLDVFSSLEEDFHEYSGLIYDGAFSEHLTSTEPKGLTGNDISEDDARNKINEVFGSENIKEISSLGENENSELQSYNFSIKNKKDENINEYFKKNQYDRIIENKKAVAHDFFMPHHAAPKGDFGFPLI